MFPHPTLIRVGGHSPPFTNLSRTFHEPFFSLPVLVRPLLTWLVSETEDRGRWMGHILRVLEEIYEIALPLAVHASLSSAEADCKEQEAKKGEFDASPAGQEAKKAEEEAEEEAEGAVRAINPEVKATICGRLPHGRWAAMTWAERLGCFRDQTRSHSGLLDSGKSRDGACRSQRDSPPPPPRSVEEGRAAPRSSRKASPMALARTRSFDDTVEESRTRSHQKWLGLQSVERRKSLASENIARQPLQYHQQSTPLSQASFKMRRTESRVAFESDAELGAHLVFRQIVAPSSSCLNPELN